MPVYIDNWGARYGRMVMCHMRADNTEELLTMADAIGVDRKWIQAKGTRHEHFDVCLSKRSTAIRMGAIEMSPKDMARMFRDREREKGEK